MKSSVMKKVLMWMVILTMSLAPFSAFADEGYGISYDAPSIYINGEYLECDVPPVIENGRTLVPIRAVSEYFKFDIKWDGEARRVEVKDGEDVLELFIDQTRYLKNGIWKELDVPAKILNGRTLVPVRLVSEEFGFDVAWIADARVIEINRIKTVEAKNAEEFLNAIDRYTNIILTGNSYNLSEVDFSKINNPNLRFEDVFDGEEIIVEDITNLTISGDSQTETKLLVETRYANVLTFYMCAGISLKNFTAGHTKEQGYCVGGVLKFENTDFVDVENCKLFGCGTYGIITDGSGYINITDSEIYECTYGLVDLYRSGSIVFDNCVFRDSEGFAMFGFNECIDVSVKNSEIKNNHSSEWSEFVEVYDSENITFENCSFKDNTYESFGSDNRALSFINCNGNE